MSVEIQSSSKEVVVKHFQKVESVGKTGKMKKGVSLSNDFSLMIKSHINDFSFKMLAYVIKGYILILKKNYENFFKDIAHFLEIHLRLRNKKENVNKEKLGEDPKAKKNKNESSANNLISNFSLLNELTQSEISGFSSDLAKQFLSTIKKMKKSNNPTLKSICEGMENGEKIENLVKHLSENVKKNPDMFGSALQSDSLNNNLINIFQENENLFSNYINFSMKLDDNQSIKSGSRNEAEIQKMDPYNFAEPSQKQEDNTKINFDDVRDANILSKLIKIQNISDKRMGSFKFDKEVNFTPEEIVGFLMEAEKLQILDSQGDSRNNNLNEASRDNLKIYMNNYKKIAANEETQKFQDMLDNNTTMNETIDLLYDIKSDHLEKLNKDSTNKKSSVSMEQFRSERRKSLSFENSMQLSNLTINDVFDDKTNIININSNDKSKRLDFNQNIQMIIEEDSNLNTLTYNHPRNAFQQLKSELEGDLNYQNEYFESLNLPNHEKVQQKIDNILNSHVDNNKSGRKISKIIKVEFSDIATKLFESNDIFPNGMLINERASLSFYNLLFVAQNKEISIHQDSGFGDLILSRGVVESQLY